MADPVESARIAGLRYVDVSAMAGLRRVRRGKHFEYVGADGRRVRDPAVLATVVRLLDITHIRVGNEEYTRENGSYGLTTLRDRHVRVRGDRLSFQFRGKSGKVHAIDVHEPRLARIVAKCSELPGHELFQYLDEDGARHSIDSSDVNAYIRAIGGEEFTAKDFRTWAGTVLAARMLCALERRGRPPKDIASCIKSVAAQLGNTPAVCRRCYIHPSILDSYVDGTMHKLRRKGLGEESFVRALLERASRMTGEQRLTTALRASVGQLQLRRRQQNRSGLHSPNAR